MIFDVERGKLDREVGGGHTRSVNVIRASKMPAYAHMVVTGGQEGQVRLWVSTARTWQLALGRDAHVLGPSRVRTRK